MVWSITNSSTAFGKRRVNDKPRGRTGIFRTFIYCAMLFRFFFLLLRDVFAVFILKSAYFHGWERSLYMLLYMCMCARVICIYICNMFLCRCFSRELLISDCCFTVYFHMALLYGKMGECATFNLPRLLSTHLD